MASFDFKTYMAREKAAGQSTPKMGPAYKVGYFKLAKDGDSAIVRFNYETPDTIHFATVHTVQVGNGSYKKISCLRESRMDDEAKCPLCAAGTDEVKAVSTKAYITLLDYEKQEDGTFKPVAKVWERPGGFAKEIAQLINDYGNLKDCLFKITRQNGAAPRDTRYIITYCRPQMYNPELYVADFSDLEDYDLTKHGYYVKTAEEMQVFLDTGDFPMRAKAEKVAEPVSATEVKKVAPAAVDMMTKPEATVTPAAQVAPASPVARPVYDMPAEVAAENIETPAPSFGTEVVPQAARPTPVARAAMPAGTPDAASARPRFHY